MPTTVQVTEPQTDYTLENEAMSLLQESRSNSQSLGNVDAWAEQSDAHRSAMQRAEKLLSLSASVPVDLGKRTDSLALQGQLMWARVQEEPVKAAVFTVLLAVLTGWTVYQPLNQYSAPPVAATNIATEVRHQTSRGEQLAVDLPDGSKAWLDWNTSLAVRYEQGSRLVDLRRGRALFDVLPDAESPFIVSAGGIQVKVTGTEFGVQYDSDEIEVGVVSGEVVVSGNDQDMTLKPGEIVTGSISNLATKLNRSVNEIASWRNGQILLNDRPLLEAIRSLAPYTTYHIDTRRVMDLDQRVTGSYPLDRADAALQALLKTHDLTATLENAQTLVVTHNDEQ